MAPTKRLGDRILDLVLWAVLAGLALRFLDFCLHAAVRPSNGFVAYYTAARLLAEGTDVGRFYDDGWFAARIAERGPAIYDIYGPNPPTAALLLLPFASLDPTGARIVWTALNLLSALAGLSWLLRELDLPGPWRRAFIAFLLLYQPAYASLEQGQAYLLLLGLLVVAWHGYRRRSDLPLGVSLGLMLALKSAAAPLWLLLLVQRRWRALAWAGATTIAISLGSLPWLGIEAWRTHLALLPGLSHRPEMAVTPYQSLPGFLHHLLTYDSMWNGAPLLQAPDLAAWLTGLGFALVAGLGAHRAWRGPESDAAFALFVAAGLILSPLSLDYHYPLALLPIALLLAWAVGRPSRGPLILLCLAALLLAADLPYRSPQLAAGAWALLAYPKLYGVAMLWGLALWASRTVGRNFLWLPEFSPLAAWGLVSDGTGKAAPE